MSSSARGFLGAGAEHRSALEIARGDVSGHATYRLSGVNKSVGATSETVWPLGGTYTFPTAATPVRVRAGGDPADDSAGAGARAIRVLGLDGDLNPTSSTIVLAGASQSAATTELFARVHDVRVTGVGTYGGVNAGNIIVETTGGNVVGGIEANMGLSRVGVSTVPAGWTAYLVGGSVSYSGSAEVELWTRLRADVAAAPFGPTRLLARRVGADRSDPLSLSAYVELPERSDIWVSALAPSGTAEVSVELEFILVRASALDPD